ncbi:MAG: NADH-quinone oxidoreductase subunit C [Chloroflexi bacterium]|nr:NADH-quinone oxidoreductase subunit C [Chloroflexota bacterium]
MSIPPPVAAETIQERVQAVLDDKVIAANTQRNFLTIEIAAADLLAVATVLRDDLELRFNYFGDVTAVHWPGETQEYEVVYHLRSIPDNRSIRVKTRIAASESIESMAQVWPGADWPEREVYDLMGIKFENHPDLRRILMDEDYEYHPLRKDFPREGL